MKYVRKISFVLTLMIIGYGLVTNTVHFLTTHQALVYNFDSKEMKEIKEMKELLEETRSRMDFVSSSVFTSEEMETIKSDIDVTLGIMDEMNLWKLEGKKRLNINELYVLENEIYSLPSLTLTSLAKIRDNHDHSGTDKMVNSSLVMVAAYHKKDIASLQDSYQGLSNLDLNPSIAYLKYYMETVNSLSTWVLEEEK